MRPRLELIAQRAGVSLATASRVINNQPHVADRTRERVLTALRELSPLQRQSLVLGLIIPDAGNPFFTELAFELDRECESRGASLLIASSDGRADRELDLLSRFTTLGVDGLVFVSSGTGQSEALLRSVEGANVSPLVALDRGVGNLDRACVDSRKGTAQAVDHLVAFGHSRIAYLKGLAHTETAIERLESFHLAMAKNRLEVDESLIFEGDYRTESGRRCADSILALPPEKRPTAILAANDLMAIALIQRLSEAGWNLPHELSIIGFDDIPTASLIHPRLTTIAQPIQRLVREVLNLLMMRITEGAANEPSADHHVIVLEPELTPRHSVARPASSWRLHAVTEAD